MSTKDILIVEDDISLFEVTRDFLEDNGFRVEHCSRAVTAMESVKNNNYSLIILDINLPDLLGFDVCTQIRKHSKVPIIFLSARICDNDKLKGFEVGADDYISKPYSLNELLLKIKAHIRRRYEYDSVESNLSNKSDTEKQIADDFSFDNIFVDFTARKLYVNEAEKDLPSKEFELLSYLIKNRNKSIQKEKLFNEIWGFNSFGEISTLSVHIRRLREKIEEDPSDPKYIKTVWSYGYRFEVKE